MAANVLPYHDRNPFYTGKTRQIIVIFSMTERRVYHLLILTPIALRVLMVLASKLNDQGYAAGTLNELARTIRTTPTYVNKGILELARHKFIAKKKQGEYWIDPDAFRSALLES